MRDRLVQRRYTSAGTSGTLTFVHENKILFLVKYVRQYHVDRRTNGMSQSLTHTARGVRALARRQLSPVAGLAARRGEHLRAHGEAKRMRTSR